MSRPAAASLPSLEDFATLSVEVVSDPRHFLTLEPLWNGLVEKTGIDHPFLRHEWFRTWWECFGAGKTLMILLVRSAGEVVGIAPLMRTRSWMYGLPVRRLQFIYNVHTPRCDFIISTAPEQVHRAILEFLLAGREPWDLMELNQVLAGSPTLETLARVAETRRLPLGFWHSQDSPYLSFAGTWEDYLKRLSQGHRAKMRSKLTRLGQAGPVGLEIVAGEENLKEALEDGLRIEAMAWKGEAGTAILSRPEVGVFYKAYARRAAECGLLRLIFLRVNRKRIAFAYAVCYRKKIYVLKTGYDPEYAPLSPYNLLCFLLFQDGFRSGLSEYEFLGGSEEWKLQWSRDARAHHWMFLFQDSLRGRLLHLIKFGLVRGLNRMRIYGNARDAILGTGRPASGQRPQHEVAGSAAIEGGGGLQPWKSR